MVPETEVTVVSGALFEPEFMTEVNPELKTTPLGPEEKAELALIPELTSPSLPPTLDIPEPVTTTAGLVVVSVPVLVPVAPAAFVVGAGCERPVPIAVLIEEAVPVAVLETPVVAPMAEVELEEALDEALEDVLVMTVLLFGMGIEPSSYRREMTEAI